MLSESHHNELIYMTALPESQYKSIQTQSQVPHPGWSNHDTAVLSSEEEDFR